MSEEKQNKQPSEEEPSEEDSTTPDALQKQISELTKKLNALEESPKFITLPKKTDTVPVKAQKKQNEEELAPFKFNAFEVFHPQFKSIEKMMTYDENCEILTMRVNVDPRHPEWQVS